jgi:hypothetical protein
MGHGLEEFAWKSVGLLGSLSLDVGGSDHLAPFLSFVGDQLVEVGGRAWKCKPA